MAESRNPRLVLRGPGKPRVADLPTLPALFGRGSECSIPAPGRTVGKTHMKISGSPAHLVVEDAGSAAGILRNGQRISGPTTVRDRDIFICGDVQVQFFLPPPAPANPSELVIEMLDPPVTGQLVTLPANTDRTLTVGRTPKNDLCIAHKKTSGEHCVIMRKANGSLVVVDQGSTNGTRVNGKDLTPNVPQEMFNGDLVQFGQVIGALRPRSYEPPVPPPAVSAADVAPALSFDDPKSSQSDSGMFQPVSSSAATPAAPSRPAEPAAGAPVDIPAVGSSPAGEVTVDPFGDLLDSTPHVPKPESQQELPIRMPWEVGNSAAAPPPPAQLATPLPPATQQASAQIAQPSGVDDASLIAEPSKKRIATIEASDVRLTPPVKENGAAAVLHAHDGVGGVGVPDPDPLVAARFAVAVGMGIPPVTGPALVALPESGETEPPPEQAIVVRLNGPILVGRKKSMNLRLPHSEISGLHAMLDPDETAKGGPTNYIVRNAGALNGVFINGVRSEAHALRHLDQVAFGPFRYLYIGDGHKYPCSLREFPAAVQKQVRIETQGEIQVRRPLVAVLFELASVTTALVLVAIMVLAWNGILPSLDECVEMVAKRFRGG